MRLEKFVDMEFKFNKDFQFKKQHLPEYLLERLHNRIEKAIEAALIVFGHWEGKEGDISSLIEHKITEKSSLMKC